MEWSKLKNIIILILAMVNLILGGLALFYWQREEGDQRAALENAVAILEEQGVSLSQVPEEMSLAELLVQRDQGREEVLAAALLGETVREDRGAGVYRYSGEKGSVQFHSNGEFSAAFAPGAYPLDGAEPEEHALGVLALLDFTGRVLDSQQEEGQTRVTVCQLWEGAPVLSCQAVLVYEGDELTAISSGRRLNGTPYAAGDAGTCVSAASALIWFVNGVKQLGDVCNTVTSMEEGYSLTSSLTGPARMTPIWYITTDTGSDQLDGLSGELTRGGAGGDGRS